MVISQAWKRSFHYILTSTSRSEDKRIHCSYEASYYKYDLCPTSAFRKIQCYFANNGKSLFNKSTLNIFYILDFLTTDDIAKLEDIKDSVLKPTKNREKRKERVKKYLKWVRTITANNQSRSNQFS